VSRVPGDTTLDAYARWFEAYASDLGMKKPDGTTLLAMMNGKISSLSS
jgi:hypothetical protein